MWRKRNLGSWRECKNTLIDKCQNFLIYLKHSCRYQKDFFKYINITWISVYLWKGLFYSPRSGLSRGDDAPGIPEMNRQALCIFLFLFCFNRFQHCFRNRSELISEDREPAMGRVTTSRMKTCFCDGLGLVLLLSEQYNKTLFLLTCIWVLRPVPFADFFLKVLEYYFAVGVCQLFLYFFPP